MPKTVAYLGPAGTFSEEAAILYDATAQRLPCASIQAVFAAVEAGKVEQGVVPIENSIEGPVIPTLDLLIHDSQLRIFGELVLPITECLMALPGTSLDAVKLVYSHPQALGQCRRYIERNMGMAQLVASLSTVAAVEEMKKSQVPAAAIGPARAADLYGVEVMARAIQDHEGNATRFVALAASDHRQTGKDKTSIAFSFSEDKPGQLFGVLSEFASTGINLAKVESRPARAGLGKYVFLIDLEGHRLDAGVAAVLAAVGKRTSMLKVFGSYPKWHRAA